jgi:CDP-diglyceride synthetase
MKDEIGILTVIGQAVLTIYAIFEAYRLRSRRPFAWRRRWLYTSAVIALALVLAWLDGDEGASEQLRRGIFFFLGWLLAVGLGYAAYRAINARYESEDASA